MISEGSWPASHPLGTANRHRHGHGGAAWGDRRDRRDGDDRGAGARAADRMGGLVRGLLRSGAWATAAAVRARLTAVLCSGCCQYVGCVFEALQSECSLRALQNQAKQTIEWRASGLGVIPFTKREGIRVWRFSRMRRIVDAADPCIVPVCGTLAEWARNRQLPLALRRFSRRPS